MNVTSILTTLTLLCCLGNTFAQSTYDTTKPWTYWWWMGSAVNKVDVQQQLEAFSEAGLGGVHIIPIYGVKGYESEFLPFLSEEWMEMVQYTIEQAHELNLGVDLTLGTGWPYGGNWIDPAHAAQYLFVKEYELPSTSLLEFGVDTFLQKHALLEIVGLFASSDQGESINLLPSKTSPSPIHQDVKKGNWTLTCFGIKNTRQQVKRAAPGGEGPVIDYFDKKATEHYLQHFDSVFAHTAHPIQTRAFYHDSYETYRADWTGQFLARFQELRGYDLKNYLPIISQPDHADRPFIIHDIRETLSELLYSEFASTWTDWSRSKQVMTRYQAHGSPGNLLDLYALADVPETESFGCSDFAIPGLQCDPDYEEERFGRPSPLMMKFASSPAHVFNKALVSSETGTWLANHFKVSLSQVKPQIDELFVSGINHIFYHGTTYSPQKEAYPGWLFYASTNFGPSSHFWEEMALLNSYIATCQRVLQNSQPDNDILLYFPIDDLWTTYPGDILLLLDVHKYSKWFSQTKFGETAQFLWDNGYSFDYISDKQLGQLDINEQGKLSIDDQNSYSVIVLPSTTYINKETLKTLNSLAEKGAHIIFADQLPESFSGFKAYKNPDSELTRLKAKLSASDQVSVSDNLLRDLASKQVRQESMKRQGLDFIRKRSEEGYLYFISNLGDQFYADSVSLGVPYQYLEIIDPQSQKRGYIASNKPFLLQLPPGKSCIIRTLNKQPNSKPWLYTSQQNTQVLNNLWKAEILVEDGQDSPNSYTLDSLRSWTDWGDESLKSFCGKVRYTTTFSIDGYNKKTKSYQLMFDDIRESAEVSINGVSCGTIWSLPYQLDIPPGVLKRKNNTLSITVQNLSANRIKQIDTLGEDWKKFYDINIVDIQYKPFDASKWDDIPSGLLGNVKLTFTSQK